MTSTCKCNWLIELQRSSVEIVFKNVTSCKTACGHLCLLNVVAFCIIIILYFYYYVYMDLLLTLPTTGMVYIIETVDSINIGMSQILHRRNTLQTGEYLALGTLSRILNTTVVFYS